MVFVLDTTELNSLVSYVKFCVAKLRIRCRSCRNCTPPFLKKGEYNLKSKSFIEGSFIVAIYHLSMQTISRGKGQSATASSAYRSGERLYSERYDKTSFYAREKQPDTFILKPNHAPVWALNRERLWNEVEHIEKSKKSRLAREINVALPRELSHEEQRNLVQEYVQNNFVDKGMVADVAIHRDDENNPHFHVMLTNRPFEENGNWGKKQRKIYLYDEQGNKLKTERGNIKSETEKITNWDNKETLKQWRKNWANIVNKYLERNSFSERITEKSYAERGIDKEPTIHEGYASREMEKRGENSDRCQINRKIKDRNHSKEMERKQYAEKATEKEISDSLSPKEKKDIRLIAKNLKVYVNYDNLMDKQRMVNNWENSTTIKGQLNPEDNYEKDFQNINDTKQDIHRGKEILEKQFTRIYEKYYPKLNEKYNYSTYYKMAIAQQTLQEDRVLSKDELAETLVGARDKEKTFMLKAITKNPYHIPLKDHMDNLTKTNKQISQFKEKHNITKETIHTLNDEDKKEYKKLQRKRNIQVKTADILNKYYTSTIQQQYPTADLEDMKYLEKEAISKTIDYYGNDYDFGTILDIADDEKVVPNRFNHRQQQLGIQYIIQLDKNNDINFNELPKDNELYDIVSDKGLRPIFLEEVKRNGLESEIQQLEQADDYSSQKAPEYSRGINFGMFANNLQLLNNLGNANKENLRREIEELRNKNSTRAKNRGRLKNKGRKPKEQSKQKNNGLSL